MADFSAHPSTAREFVLAAAAHYPRTEEIGSETHQRRGIPNSEMLAIIAVATELRLDVLVESGRARGHSTLLLAKYLGVTGTAIHSFERHRDSDAVYAEEKLAELPNLFLHYGDSRIAIPALIASLANRRIGLLIDGPKDRKALNLLSDCLIKSDAITAAFVHDLPIRSGVRSEGRIYAERYFSDPFFTDDDAYVEAYRHMDHGNLPKPNAGASQDSATSYGPTLGIFLPTPSDRMAARKRGLNGRGLRRVVWQIKESMRRGKR